ncbi:NYN domain protein [Pseudomonas aeruginosa]|nr:NYN domain-containing protein [Pseudomonas aeruginosa]CRN71157.1 NYN domain protein [Pseudomonas aeruginosa]
MTSLRTGIYVDSDNISINGGKRVRYETIRRYYEASGLVTQMHAYLAFDETRAEESADYATWHSRHLARIIAAGCKVHCKPCKSYRQDSGSVVTKGNCDVELTVDVMLHAGRLDRVVLVTGDGDFVSLVHALQDQGIRVEVMAISRISSELREAADIFVQAMIVPEILAADDIENCQHVVEIVRVNRSTMMAEYRYLDGYPTSISAADPAWRTSVFQLSAAMFESRAFVPGSLAAWNGKTGSGSAFKPLT